MKKFFRCGAFAGFGFLLGAMFAPDDCIADVQYTLTDLGSLGGADSRALSINNSGTVVGWAYADSDENAHAYTFDGSPGQTSAWMTDIHPENLGYKSVASAVSDTGWVSGHIIDNLHLAHATFWQNGECVHVESGPGESLASGINNSGQSTGRMTVGSSWHAFWYSPNSSGAALQDIGTLGGSMSAGLAVNANGTVVGYSLTSSPEWQQHAFSFSADSGTMIDLGTLGGSHSQANGINDSGKIVGWSWRDDGRSEAFIYSNDTCEMLGIGRLGGYSSVANGINSQDETVGWWSENGYDRRAFIYKDGSMLDLNTLLDENTGWQLVEAKSINDSGQIVGYGIDPSGIDRGFLLTPVSIPTPSGSLVLVLFGAFLARKR